VPTVLITGASRGIGRATALWLAARGWHVFAGVRRPEDGEALVASGTGQITPVTLDISDDEQVAGLETVLPGTLDAVVNNAGVVVGGPVEAVPVSELRRQLEINVVAQAAVTQAVLPRLRASRGRLVYVSSVSGLIATPMMGPYSASKFALEEMVDALRMEVKPWGIRVSLVLPAQTDTDLWRGAEQELDASTAALAPNHRELYAKHIAGSQDDPAFDKGSRPRRRCGGHDREGAHCLAAAGPLRGRGQRPGPGDLRPRAADADP
jgi:NAD(P)-dependent dehydrogenase (short-subunit alcohol dehydrogenase family)